MDEYLVYDPEYDAYFAPGEPTSIPAEYCLHFLDDLTEEDFHGPGPHLFTVDELRAAGALSTPESRRKPLGKETDEERPLFSGLIDNDEPSNAEEAP